MYARSHNSWCEKYSLRMRQRQSILSHLCFPRKEETGWISANQSRSTEDDLPPLLCCCVSIKASLLISLKFTFNRLVTAELYNTVGWKSYMLSLHDDPNHQQLWKIFIRGWGARTSLLWWWNNYTVDIRNAMRTTTLFPLSEQLLFQLTSREKLGGLLQPGGSGILQETPVLNGDKSSRWHASLLFPFYLILSH